ncbi:MAG TPA: YjbE family putative metal transport protein [Ktedonobacterales bacterium]|jgi:YjbE family integral membrane protein
MILPFTLPSISPPTFDLTFFASAAGILLIDLVLSGDNALVIGATASRLPRSRRMLAIVLGGVGAVLFRLILASVATTLLQISLLRAIGGVILLFIAIRLLIGESDDQRARFQAHDRLLPAVLTILLADATMSLDNVLAVGALAHGDIWLLVAGLLLSMLLLFIASALIAQIVERFTWLIDLAAVVLAWTAAGLFLDDALVKSRFPALEPWGLFVRLGAIAFVLVIDLVLRRARRRGGDSTPQVSDTAPVAGDDVTQSAPSQAPEEADVARGEALTD